MAVYTILAQEESNSISQALNWAIKERRKMGDPIKPACYGYRRDKHRTDGVHKWHIVEEEAIRVKLVFHYYLSGNTMPEVAKKLNEFEKANGGNLVWKNGRVRYILGNVAYIGDLECGSTYTADYLSKKRKQNKGERERYYISNHHEPIISKEDFEKAAKIREANSRRKDRKCN